MRLHCNGQAGTAFKYKDKFFTCAHCVPVSECFITDEKGAWIPCDVVAVCTELDIAIIQPRRFAKWKNFNSDDTVLFGAADDGPVKTLKHDQKGWFKGLCGGASGGPILANHALIGMVRAEKRTDTFEIVKGKSKKIKTEKTAVFVSIENLNYFASK